MLACACSRDAESYIRPQNSPTTPICPLTMHLYCRHFHQSTSNSIVLCSFNTHALPHILILLGLLELEDEGTRFIPKRRELVAQQQSVTTHSNIGDVRIT